VAATPKVVITKSFVYRGGTQLWSNAYHFNGGTPASGTAWDTLFDNIVNAEKAALRGSSTIVKATGYAAGATIASRSKSYTTAGTLVTTGGIIQAGDVAALVRFATTALSSKNHPVYLFNYYHDVCAASTDRDTLLAAQKTALETYATAWIAGFSDGANTYVRSGPNGATAVSRFVNPLVTHRDFPR
jgi:hypothetical protein